MAGSKLAGVLRALTYSVLFVVGLAITFTALGMIAALAGTMYGDVSGVWNWIVAAHRNPERWAGVRAAFTRLGGISRVEGVPVFTTTHASIEEISSRVLLQLGLQLCLVVRQQLRKGRVIRETAAPGGQFGGQRHRVAAMLFDQQCQLQPVLDAGLVEDGAEVRLDRALADFERAGDAFVALAVAHQLGDLALSAG